MRPPAFPTGAGFEVTCTVTIENTITAQGVTSSTVTATACLAAAGVLPPAGRTTTVTTSSQLVTSVDQCNGIVYGGGSNVTCNITVNNNIPVGTPTTGVTVDQCVGSGTGGGTQPTVVCSPLGVNHQCHGHPVQRLRERRGRTTAGAVHSLGYRDGAARDDHSVQWFCQRRRKHRDLHDHGH